MVAPSTPVPPFFVPRSPPLPFPMLTSQTELVRDPQLPKLTAQEDLSLRHRVATKKDRRRHCSPFPGAARVTFRSPSFEDTRSKDYQYRRSSLFVKPTNSESNASGPSPVTDGSVRSASPYESSDESQLSDASEEIPHLIKKPPGEAGRPGCGGYNIQVALDWNTVSFERLKVRYFVCVDTAYSNRNRNTYIALLRSISTLGQTTPIKALFHSRLFVMRSVAWLVVSSVLTIYFLLGCRQVPSVGFLRGCLAGF
jgi:hypothetical protein